MTGRSWLDLFPYLTDDEETMWQALAELEALPDPEAVETARNALDTAREAYDNAVADSALAELEWSQTVATAEQAISDAEADYAAAFTGWLGVSPSAAFQPGADATKILE